MNQTPQDTSEFECINAILQALINKFERKEIFSALLVNLVMVAVSYNITKEVLLSMIYAAVDVAHKRYADQKD